MSKHTPGPWIQVGAWVEVEDDNIPDICSCNPESISQGHLQWDWKTIEANARLIAAAPDMLDALKICESVLRIKGYKNAAEIACAAIYKATGNKNGNT